MYEIADLSKMTKEELKKIATEFGLKKISSLKKSELIESILSAEKKSSEETEKKEEINDIKEKPEETKEKKQENIIESADMEKKDETHQQEIHQHKKRERPADVVELTGILDVMEDGYGFLRFENYSSSSDDVYVAPAQIKRFRLKTGDEITGDCRKLEEEGKSWPLLFVKKINGDTIETALKRRPFEKLVPIYPIEKIKLENDKKEYSNRLIDLISPIGKGQRGMIVAPPKAGKTTIIKSMAQAIRKNNPEIKMIILLIDERPEEVTDIRKSIDCDVIYSTFDQLPENHCKISEMVLERAQRLVEQNKDVVILMDSITRLVRAYNHTVPVSGRTLTGGLDPAALYKPKKFFGAARKIENGGSLTIIATALVETGSRMDDVIFEEFKGTGNMELKLDRYLQEKRIFPAIDILKSGTRREEDLLTKEELAASWILRSEIAKSGQENYVKMLQLMRASNNNTEFINYLVKNRSL